MEKLLRKTGINQSLRLLLIIASCVFGSSANVWAEDLTTTFDWAGSKTATGGTTDYVVTQSPVKLTFSLGTASNAPRTNKEGSVRMYEGTQLTISLEGDYVIKQVDFTPTTKSYNATKLKFNGTSLTSDSWVLSSAEQANSVTLTASATARFKKIVVTYASTSSGGGSDLTDRNLSFGETKSFDAEVGDDTFSEPDLTGVTDGGVTYVSSNEDVASVNASTGAVTIKGMGHATITASAEANETYKLGSASYDIYVYDSGTLEDLKAYITSTNETEIYFDLTSNAVVTYAATNYAYMEDGHAGIYLYKKGHGLKAGNSFTGKVIAKGKLYNQLYEFTDFTPANTAGTAGITATNWTIQDLTDSGNTGYKMAESMRVKLTGVTATTDGTNWTIEQGGASTTLVLYNSLSVTAGGVYDITGYPYNNNGTWEFRVYEESCLEQKGGKTAATVTFDEENYTVETNGSITVSATKNSTSPIVYSISPADGNVSINANTGEIVAGKNPGTYTITASVAENENFTSASADCTLTVKAPSFNIAAPTYYKKITSTDELAAYLIVCEGAKKALSATVSTVDYTQGENNTVTNETPATLGEFELIGTDENYKGAPLYEFLVDNKYLSGTTSTTISLATSVSDKTKWMVDFDEDGNVEIDSYSTFSVSETNRGLIYQNSGKVIKHYAVSNRGENGYSKVQLYQKVTDLAISTLTNGYATFVTDVPYVMPKGACGYAVTVAPHVGVITKTEAYTEGSQVPAQTALLIGGAPGTNYYPAVLKEDVTATYSGENYMEGRRTAEGYTNSQRGVDVYYYKLALNSASEPKPGFYYGATGGAAFKLTKPTTAYLAVPKNITPVNGYLIDFDGEETGISTIAPTNGNTDGTIYNLNGIRLTQTLRNLPKGVYIVNGKKVIK